MDLLSHLVEYRKNCNSLLCCAYNHYLIPVIPINRLLATLVQKEWRGDESILDLVHI
jgi:hypothetical protein